MMAPTSSVCVKWHICKTYEYRCRGNLNNITTRLKSVIIHKNLNFKEHSNILSNRVRQPSNMMKILRSCAHPDTQKCILCIVLN